MPFTHRKWFVMYTSPGCTGVVAPASAAHESEPAPVPARCAGIELVALPSAVSRARHWAADQLAGAEPPPAANAIDDAVLVVSELVTNAIRALGPGPDLDRVASDSSHILLLITRLRGTIRIEVHDSVRGSLPPPRHDDLYAESGRGRTVIESLSIRRGLRPAPHGKIVWCELAG